MTADATERIAALADGAPTAGGLGVARQVGLGVLYAESRQLMGGPAGAGDDAQAAAMLARCRRRAGKRLQRRPFDLA